MSILGKSITGKYTPWWVFVRLDKNKVLSKIEDYIIFTFMIKVTDKNTLSKKKDKNKHGAFLPVVFLSVFRLSFMHS